MPKKKRASLNLSGYCTTVGPKFGTKSICEKGIIAAFATHPPRISALSAIVYYKTFAIIYRHETV